MSSKNSNNASSPNISEKVREAYAYHKIILNNSGKPCDYKFIDINSKFEEMTGLGSEDIIDKNVTDVLPGIRDGAFDWVEFYGRVALDGVEETFDQFCEPLGKWYRVTAFSPEQEYFVTLFTELSRELEEIEEKEDILTAVDKIILELDNEYMIKKVIPDTKKPFFGLQENIVSTNLFYVFPVELAQKMVHLFEKTYLTREKAIIEYPSFSSADDKWFSAEIYYIENERKSKYIVSISDITLKKQAELQLKEREKKYRLILNNANSIIYSMTPDGVFTYLSPSFKWLVGYDPSEVVGQLSHDFIYPADLERVTKKLMSILKTGTEMSYEFRTVTKDGDIRWLNTNENPVFTEKGEISSIIGVAHDITDRVIAENKLKESEFRFRSLVDNVPGVIFRCKYDNNWTMLYLTDKIKQITGYDPSDFIDNSVRSYSSIIHPEDRQQVIDDVKIGFQQELPYELNYRIITKDGEIKWIREYAQKVYADTGNMIDGVITDITRSVQKDLELKEKQELLEKFFSRAITGFFILLYEEPFEWSEDSDKDKILETAIYSGKMVQVNQAMLDQYHATEDEFIGITLAQLFENDIGNCKDIVRELLDNGSIFTESYETRMDGTQMWVEGDYTCLYDHKNRIIGHIGVQQDVTDRKIAENKLKESERQVNESLDLLSGILESFDDTVVFAIDKEYRYIAFNENHKNTMRLIWGVDIELGKSMLDYIHDSEDHEKAKSNFDRAMEGEYFKVVEQYGDTEFDRRWYENSYNPLYDSDNDIIGVALLLSDITDRKKHELEIIESKKLLEAMFESIQDGISIMDPDMTIKKVNRYMEDLHPNKVPLEGKKCYQVYRNRNDVCDSCPVLKTFETHETCTQVVPHIDKDSGTDRKLEVFSYPIIDNDGNVVNVVEFLRDITDRIKVEKLERNQVLIQEIHHRVKNNLQVIISLLNMQSNLFTDEKIKGAFRESQSRIRSMSLAHEKLYAGDNVANVEISDYITSLVNHIKQMNMSVNIPVEIDIDVDELYLNMDTTIPLGLLVNEIVTNSFKHAFDGRDKGNISISFKEIDEGYNLVIQDDGIGLPDDININDLNSLGLKIIDLLVQQLGGKVEVNNSNGTCYIISISN
ncbi:PAS domain S-box protein [Methanosalsum natronophilum]|uniref:PAS domain S-box protein n=1 Tax=Methanosalsum natronophilum TaxID=768733 RepID=UPI0021685881|nr:PAS domain S-box protein [Methanosalsum natronophilum]MCS3923855.1 PAS domain S-box-containing protein [Methanosalsum natronophilum]